MKGESFLERVMEISVEEVVELSENIAMEAGIATMIVITESNDVMQIAGRIRGLVTSAYAIGREQGRKDKKHSMTFVVREETNE